MKTKSDLKPELFAAMAKAEEARAARKRAQSYVPEWKAEAEAVKAVADLYAEYLAAPGDDPIKPARKLRSQLFDRLRLVSDSLLVAVWNRVSNPSKPRTDAQHAVCSKVNRAALAEIERRRLATRELSNGALMLQ
jgi:hypothetical protein